MMLMAAGLALMTGTGLIAARRGRGAAARTALLLFGMMALAFALFMAIFAIGLG